MATLHNKKPSFGEHLEPILKYAGEAGMSLTELFEKAGVELKRKSDFEKGRKTLTSHYFLKLLTALGLSMDAYETKTRMKFSQEQRKELKYQQYMEIYKKAYEKPMLSPKLHKAIMALIEAYED